MNYENKVLIISGPTASGKSAIAEYIFDKNPNAVIINADSMQVYDGLQVLTASPLKTLAHHRLYNYVCASDTTYSVAKWYTDVVNVIKVAWYNDQLPVVVGGTGFYIKTLLEGISPMPEAPYNIREALLEKLEKVGAETLYNELSVKDPELPSHIKPADTQRIIRAYEVLLNTGKSISYFQKLPNNKKLMFDFYHLCVLPPREALYERIEKRFDNMVHEHNVLNDIKAFLDKPYATTSPLKAALGYKELDQYLEKKIPLQAAVAKAKQVTRNFAKRQITFYKHQFEKIYFVNSISEALQSPIELEKLEWSSI